MKKAFLSLLTGLFLFCVQTGVMCQYYGLVTKGISESSFNSTYQAFLDYADGEAITLPSSANQTCQNDLIQSLEDDGILAKLDAFWMFAGAGSEDMANINLIDPGTNTVTVNGSPNYTTLDGYEKTDGTTTDYLDTNFDGSTDATNYSLDDCTMGGWFILNTVPNDGVFYRGYGANNTSGAHGILIRRFSGTTSFFRQVNDGVPVSETNSIGTSGGAISTVRGSSTVNKFSQNTTQVTDSVSSSGSFNTNDIYILSLNIGSPSFSYSGLEVSLFWIGGELTDTELDDLYNSVNTYMSCIE